MRRQLASGLIYASHLCGFRTMSKVVNVSLELILSSMVSVSRSFFLLVFPPLLDPDRWKIDGKVSASSGFWVFVLFKSLSRGRKNRAHWIGGEELMKWDQAWQIRVAFVRRVRVSKLSRISSKISGMERAWDWAEVGGGAIGVKKKKKNMSC